MVLVLLGKTLLISKTTLTQKVGCYVVELFKIRDNTLSVEIIHYFLLSVLDLELIRLKMMKIMSKV